MTGAAILQAQGASVDSFVVFLAVLLLVFPLFFVRSLLKGWRPVSTGGLFWKALLVFSAPFYIGIIVVKLFSVTGLVSPEFGQLFPSLQGAGGKLPEIEDSGVNFWSEYTVGLMAAALISGIAAILIYSIFKDRKTSRQKIGGLVFWGALYASAIIVANGVFDRVQEAALEGQAKKTEQQREVQQKYNASREGEKKGFGERIFLIGSSQGIGTSETATSYDERFRKEKTEAEIEKGAKAREAPDGVIAEFLRLTNRQVQMLAGQDPLACHYFLQTGTFLRRFQNLFETTNTSPEMANLLEALAREAERPSDKHTPKLNANDFKAATGKLYDNIRNNTPKENQNFEVFDNPQKLITRKQKTQGCFTYGAYLDEISKMPPEDAVRYYRALLENRANALNAESALAENQDMLKLYQELAGPGSALGILFEDNPNLKLAFVLYLIDNYDGDIGKTRQAGRKRKRDLLNANIRYYFALATDSAVFGHIAYHMTFLDQLSDAGPTFCGRLAGVLEESDAALVGNAYYDRHENTLPAIMKSSRVSGNADPNQLSVAEYDTTKATIETAMGRVMKGRSADMDMLFYANERESERERAKACEQAKAFYFSISRLGQKKATAFLRTMLLEETP